MKRKFLPLISVLAAMTLVACGGGKGSVTPDSSVAPESSQPVPSSQEKPSSETPASSSKADPSSAKPSSSEEKPSSSSVAPAATMAITGANLVKKEDGKVYLKVVGTAANYAAGTFKFALGLEHIKAVDGGEGFAYGSETPADADYKFPGTITGGNFVVEICISGLEGVNSGLYKVYTGAKGFYGTIGLETCDMTRVKDDKYGYNFRNDEQCNSVFAIAMEDLPPVALEEAKVYEEDGKVWAQIGGGSALKAADVAEWTPFVQFQNVNNWSNSKVESSGIRWNFKTDGKAYIEADVTNIFGAGGNYNTHLNLKENKQQDCKMETKILQKYELTKIIVEVFSDPTQNAAGNEGFWGNLGWRVTVNPKFVPTWSKEASKTVTNADGKAVKQYADDMGNSRIAIAAKDFSSSSEGAIKSNDSKGVKLNRNGSLTYKVDVEGLKKTNWWEQGDPKKTVTLIVGNTPGSENHIKRHLWNDALGIPEGAPEGTSAAYNEGSNPDQTTEAAWRIGVKVNGKEVAITNYKTLAESGLKANQLGYITLCNIDLVNGENTIEISQNDIGYSFVFGGEIRMEWKGNDTFITDHTIAENPEA